MPPDGFFVAGTHISEKAYTRAQSPESLPTASRAASPVFSEGSTGFQDTPRLGRVFSWAPNSSIEYHMEQS